MGAEDANMGKPKKRTMGALAGKAEPGAPVLQLAAELGEEIEAWIKSRAFRLSLDHAKFRGAVLAHLNYCPALGDSDEV